MKHPKINLKLQDMANLKYPPTPKLTKPETPLLKLIRSGIYPSISPIKSSWVGRLEKGT